MIGIATIIGFLVIFQSMYTAVMERTREIGILKSMGAGKFAIISVVLRETMLLAFAGIALGTGATYLLSAILHKRFPTLAFAVTPDWVLKAVLIALLPVHSAARCIPHVQGRAQGPDRRFELRIEFCEQVRSGLIGKAAG